MSPRRLYAASLFLAALALAAMGAFSHAQARQHGPEVRLGFVATFSGENFRSGRDALEAARFAVETANKAGVPVIDGKPCRVTLFTADDKASPAQAARAVRDLIAHKHVMAVIGPYPSDLADAAAKAADAAGVPLIAPAATAAVVTAGRPHIFRIAFTDAFQGQVLGMFARKRLNLSRVAVIANKDRLASVSLSDAFVRAFTACGGTARVFSYEDRNRDFGDVAREALADTPQAVFLPNASKEAVLAALALRKAGFTGTLLGGDGLNGPEVSGLAAFAGAYYVDHWREDCPRAASRRYVAAFRRARRQPPTELGALTQDAVDAVLTAVARAGSVAPEAVTRALMALPPLDGVTGTFDFVDDGNPVKSLFIAKVTDDGSRIEPLEMPPSGDPCP